MALLQVEVLEAVSEQVEVGGGRIEIVVDADAETAEISLEYWDGPLQVYGYMLMSYLAVGRRKVLGNFPQRLGNTQRILVPPAAVLLTADRPDDGHHDQEGQ